MHLDPTTFVLLGQPKTCVSMSLFFVSVFLSANVIIEYPFKLFIDMLNLKTTDLEKYLDSKKKEKKWVCLLGCLPFS